MNGARSEKEVKLDLTSSILDPSVWQKAWGIVQVHWTLGLLAVVVIGYIAVQLYKIIRALVKIAMVVMIAAVVIFLASVFVQ